MVKVCWQKVRPAAGEVTFLRVPYRERYIYRVGSVETLSASVGRARQHRVAVVNRRPQYQAWT